MAHQHGVAADPVMGAGPFLRRRGWCPAAVSLAAHLAFGAVVGLAVRGWAGPKDSESDLLTGRAD